MVEGQPTRAFQIMGYIRFVRLSKIKDQSSREGFFCAAYELRDSPGLNNQTVKQVEDLLAWFRKNLTTPQRFGRSTSKGQYRRNTKGICWYKDVASAVIEKSFELAQLLSDNGYPIEVLRTERPGYIVYEDDQQIVAEPFSDTPA